MSTKGKTYEEIYGSEKAAELKELRRKNATAQMKVQRKGKTHIEIHGTEKAKEIFKKMSNNNSGKGNPNYQGGKRHFNCKNCNKDFITKKYYTDNRNKLFCSVQCRGEAQSKQVQFKCQVCNKEYSRKESWGESKFCSRTCYNIWKCGENNPNWQGGISFEPYNTTWTKELRLFIRTRDNFTCQLCDLTEQQSLLEIGRILTVHHIDYNKQNCNESNLITTCVKCNSKVNGNRDYWFSYFTYILENQKKLELV